MTIPFQRRSPGKGNPPMAEEWNGFIEAYQAYRSGSRFDFESAAGGPSQTIAKVRNLTGGNLPRFAVVELGEFLVGSSPNFSEFATKLSFEGSAPTAATGNRIGVVLDPIGQDAVGRTVVAGAVPCLVDVTDESHWFAGAVAGDTSGLESFAKGPIAILWKEPGLGPKWAVVRLGSGLAKASKSEAPDAAYVEYTSRLPSTAYPELYPALWYERNLDADGSVEWLPTASWAQMANLKLPTMQHLYPGFQVDNQFLIEDKPTYTTEGDCCDDDIPNPYYSGGECPEFYCWDEATQQCVCCDPSCCGADCWDEVQQRCYNCCDPGYFFNPSTGECDPVDSYTCSGGVVIPTVLRCTIEWDDPAYQDTYCPGFPVSPWTFPLIYHPPGDPDPYGDTHVWYGDYNVAPAHYATIQMMGCNFANGTFTPVLDTATNSMLGGHVGNTGLCFGTIVMSSLSSNQVYTSFTRDPDPISLVAHVGLWKITIDEYP